jgi:hypothetical protein
MNAITVEDKVEELLACLGKDAQHIEQSLSQLNQLRTLVIKRDDGDALFVFHDLAGGLPSVRQAHRVDS